MTMKSWITALGALLMFSAPLASQAQAAHERAWPTQPIRLIVPFPPGGAVDSIARMLAPEFEKVLGQPMVVDNKPGASAAIASSAVLQAPPDGEGVQNFV